MKKIFFIIIFFLILKFNYSQRLGFYLNPFGERVYQSIDDYFVECQKKCDTNYTGKNVLYLQLSDTTISKKIEKIKLVIKYKKGLEYEAIGYYENRQKYRESHFSNCHHIGTSTTWYKDGSIKDLIIYNDSGETVVGLSFYKNHQIKGYIYKLEFSKEWYDTGELMGVATYKDSSIHTEKSYYKNGNIKIEATFSEGKQPLRMYYENGQIALSGYIYNNPFYCVGKWTEWYENGQIKREYYYNDSIPNQKEGIWKWYGEKGKLIKKEVYKNGKIISCKEFNLNNE